MAYRITHLTVALASCLFAAASAALVPIPDTEQLPYKRTGNPETRDVPFLAWPGGLKNFGYTEEEFLMSGMANVYEYINDANESPAVQPTVQSAGNYTTRILVRMPKRKNDFNGVVHLEILNATASYDGAPMWDLTHPSIMEDGSAWVGVTYSEVTSAFMRNTWGKDRFPAPEGAQKRDRSRYAELKIPTRSYTWDILNQAAALLKADGDDRNPLQGYGVDTIIVSGYSQSAAFVTTFSNSFYPSYSEANCTEGEAGGFACDPIVNGYIVAAGGPTARLLDGFGSHPLGDRRNCENARRRDAPCIETSEETLPVASPYPLPKIMRFTSESDIKSVRVRQSMLNQPNLRTYEVAGTSHVDYWGNVVGRRNSQFNFGLSNKFGAACDLNLNPLRTGIPLSAIQHRLAKWIQSGEEPPPSHFIDFQGTFADGTQSWVRDADDNVIGGVRPPRIEVPLGSYYGGNRYSGPTPAVAQILCEGITGGAIAFSPAEVQARYSDRATWVILNWWNVWLAYQDGFLLPVDAQTLMDEVKAYRGLPETPD